MLQFYIDGKAKEEISRVVKHAKSNSYSLDDMLDILKDPERAPGNFSEHRAVVYGHVIVVSYEWQPFGEACHISVSKGSQHPHPATVQMIMQEIGFKNELQDCVVYEAEGAIHIIERVDGVKDYRAPTWKRK
jgi:hypothetical protein